MLKPLPLTCDAMGAGHSGFPLRPVRASGNLYRSVAVRSVVLPNGLRITSVDGLQSRPFSHNGCMNCAEGSFVPWKLGAVPSLGVLT